MPYYTPSINPQAIYKAELSRREAEEFIEHELKCPVCGFIIGVAYSDSTGHLKIKCQKCKTISVLNFAYFCRRKHYMHRNKTKYTG